MFLNVGCGDDVRGKVRMDINPEKGGVNLIADAHRIPIRDNVFDYVFCKSSLEHLISPFKGLSEMARVSREFVRVIIPNVYNWRRIMRTLLSPLYSVRETTKHLQAWDGKAFKHLIHQIKGLVLVNIEWEYFRSFIKQPSMLFGLKMIVTMRVII